MVQTNTVTPGTLSLLRSLMSLEILQPYYLVGGTALALQIGHRLSFDIDLHGKVPLDYENLVKELEQLGKVVPIKEFDKVHQFVINDVRVDIVNRNYSLIKPILKIDGIRMASLEDIAAMKIYAIESRGYRRDFVDLFCLLDKFSLDQIIQFTHEKYPSTNMLHVTRSLLDFHDAEEDEDPKMFNPISWEAVKDRIRVEVRRIVL